MANSTFIPAYDHIVVVMEENHSYDEIIGNSQAPYINSLARSGAVLSNYRAVAHPSEPNYFALYAGSTFGVTDDAAHHEPGPTLGSILAAHHRSFVGYVESGSPAKHNPWESFPEGFSVEQNTSSFPSDFSTLPTVSFVVPNLADDMHDGTIAQGDGWLRSHIDAYAHWAVANNSLLVVTFDEDDSSEANRVPTILVGAHIATGINSTASNHYDLLHTILQASGLPAPNNAANAAGLDGAIFMSDPLFGSITNDPNSAGGLLYNFYDAYLGRTPNAPGFENWVAAFQSGSSLPEITLSFLGSDEFTNHFGAYQRLSAHDFIEALYQTALNRPAEPQGLADWEYLLANGTLRQDVALGIALSSEHEQIIDGAFSRGVFVPSLTDATIARLYHGLLDRAPDGPGLRSWEDAAAGGLSLETISRDFISSPEYQNLHGAQTDQQFVEALYEGALGRAPDPPGEQNYLTAMSHGMTRSDVALSITGSLEAQMHLAPAIEYGHLLA